MNRGMQVLKSFKDLYGKMAWLNGLKMKEALKGFQASEIHCIERIGKTADPNVTKLAEAFFMTRGAISKVTKKLIEKGVIESYRKPGNKKEIYFRLTEYGQQVFQIHEDLHNEFEQRDKAVFDQLSEEQIRCLLAFAQTLDRHLDAEIKKQGAVLESE